MKIDQFCLDGLARRRAGCRAFLFGGVLLAALAVRAQVFTYNGSGTTFSTAFTEGVPPAGDPSVVLDFSSATVAADLENDLEGLKVNRLVGPNSGVALTVRGNAFAFAADGDAKPSVSYRGAVNLYPSVTLESDLTTSGLSDNRLSLYGKVSGAGTLFVKSEFAAITAASQVPAAIVDLKAENDFTGGISLVGGCCHLRCQGAAGSGTLWQTNTFVCTTAKGKPLCCAFTFYPPQTVGNKIILSNEKYNGYAPGFVMANDNSSGDVVVTSAILSDEGKLANYALPTSALRLRGGFDPAGSNNILLLANSGPIFIEETPINAPARDLWSCSANQPVVLAVAGNRVRCLCGYAGGDFRFDVDNAFANRPFFAPQGTGTQWIQFNLNGTTQVMGGHETGGSACDPYVRKMLIRNLSQTPATITITQDRYNNPHSPLTFSGKVNVVKDGPLSLVLTNAPSLSGTLTVKNGTLGVTKGETKTISYITAKDGVTSVSDPLTGKLLADGVVLAGGVLDLGGQDWIVKTLAVDGGKIVNGGSITPASRACEVAAGDLQAKIVSADLVKDGAGSARVTVSPEGTAVPTPATYALPEGTLAFYPFDTALTLMDDYTGQGHTLVNESGALAWNETGAARGCAAFDGNSWCKMPAIPSHLLAKNAYTISWWAKFDYAAIKSKIYTGNTEYGMVGFGDQSGSDAGANQTWACFTLKNTKGGSHTSTDDSVYYEAGFYTYGGARFSQMPFSKTTWNVVTNGEWHLFTLTCDPAQNGTRRWYLDGTCRSEATGDYSYTIPNAKNPYFLFGKGMWGYGFKGWMDELIVLDHALSQEEVTTLYEQKSFAYTPGGERVAKVVVGEGTLLTDGDRTCVYHFDDTALIGKDSGPYGYDLETVGTVTYADGVSPFGKGGSLYVAESGYLKSSAYFDRLPRDQQTFTFGCFFRYDTSQKARYDGRENGWMHFGSNGQYQGISIARLANGAGIVYWNDYNLWPTFQGIADGNWHHSAVTWDGATLTCYLDGAVAHSSKATSDHLSKIGIVPGNFYIGRAMNGYWFTGWIDEAAVFNKALSKDEIDAWRANGLADDHSAILPAGTEADVTAGATLDLSGRNETLARCSGAGTLIANELTVTGAFDMTGTLAADLVWADGVTVEPGEPPVTVNGSVTLLGGGTLTLPSKPDNGRTDVVLATGVTGVVGADRFAGWSVTYPEGAASASLERRLILKNGALIARLGRNGCLLLIR